MIRRYDEEFKRDALKLATEIGVGQTSEKLNVSTKALYAWQRAERLKRGIAAKGLKPGESAEEGFKRLEQENAELREANNILKKALGFMAGR
jgi:transposase